MSASATDEISNRLGERLLQGWTMLSEACDRCEKIPLMRDRSGKQHCLLCESTADTSPSTAGEDEHGFIAVEPNPPTADKAAEQGKRNASKKSPPARYFTLDTGAEQEAADGTQGAKKGKKNKKKNKKQKEEVKEEGDALTLASEHPASLPGKGAAAVLPTKPLAGKPPASVQKISPSSEENFKDAALPGKMVISSNIPALQKLQKLILAGLPETVELSDSAPGADSLIQSLRAQVKTLLRICHQSGLVPDPTFTRRAIDGLGKMLESRVSLLPEECTDEDCKPIRRILQLQADLLAGQPSPK